MSTGSPSLSLVAFGDSHSEFSRIQHPWQDFHWAEEVEHNKQHSPICYFSVNKFKFQLLNFQISSQDPANQTFPHQVLHQQYQHLLAHFLSSAPKLPLENISPDFFIQAKIHSPTKPSVATFKVTLFRGCFEVSEENSTISTGDELGCQSALGIYSSVSFIPFSH